MQAEQANDQLVGVTLEALANDADRSAAPNAHLASIHREELERKKYARQLSIPTDDSAVRKWLRAAREPITLFGEGPYERRERLRALLALPENSAVYRRLLETAQAESTAANADETADDREEFFVPGSEELLEARRWLLAYSLERAKRRIQSEKAYRSMHPATVKDERTALYNRVRSFGLLGSQVGSERPLSACVFSPDAQLIATGDFSGGCRLWSTKDCALVSHMDAVHVSRIGALAFSPASSSSSSPHLASCDNDGKIALWSTEKTSCVAELKGHTARVAHVAWHPSGRFLGSASFDYSWRLWDVERRAELQLQEGHSRPVYAVGFHADGALAATGGLDAHGRVWDLRLGKAIWTLKGHVKSILSVEFNPKLPTIATASEDGTVRIWDLRRLQPAYIIPAHTSVASAARWSADGSLLLTCGFEGTAKLWGAYDWKPLASLSAHESKVLSADLCADASLAVTCSADRTFKLWAPQ